MEVFTKLQGPHNKKEQVAKFFQEECMFCEKPLLRKNYRNAVKDHCHISGRFRGAAHWEGNKKLRLNVKTLKIPVTFHNLKGYDAHIVMQAMANTDKGKN